MVEVFDFIIETLKLLMPDGSPPIYLIPIRLNWNWNADKRKRAN